MPGWRIPRLLHDCSSTKYIGMDSKYSFGLNYKRWCHFCLHEMREQVQDVILETCTTEGSVSLGPDSKSTVAHQPMLGRCWTSVSIVFVVCSALAALVRPRCSFFVQLNMLNQWRAVSETYHSEWLFSLANQCTRNRTKVMKASKRWLKQRGHF